MRQLVIEEHVCPQSDPNYFKYALSLCSNDHRECLNKLTLADSDSLPGSASIEDWLDDMSKRPNIHSYLLDNPGNM